MLVHEEMGPYMFALRVEGDDQASISEDQWKEIARKLRIPLSSLTNVYRVSGGYVYRFLDNDAITGDELDL